MKTDHLDQRTSPLGQSSATASGSTLFSISTWHLALALASLAAGGIHFAVMGDHFQEDLAVGLFFAAVAWAQVTWAVGMLVFPGRLLLLAGLVGNLGVIVIWAVSRTSGLPVGPDPWTAEAAGRLDILATAVELAIVVGCGVLLARRSAGLEKRGRGPILAFGLILAVLTSSAIATAGEHLHSPAAADHHGSAAPAGDHDDSAGGDHGHGSELDTVGLEHSGPAHYHPASLHDPGTPDPEQMDLIRTAMAKYQDVSVARADGYEQMDGDYAETGAHFGRPERTASGAFSTTGDLDLRQPEYLMYTKRLTGEWKLVAVAFVMDMWEYPAPPTKLVGAPYHEHVWNCLGDDGETFDEEEYGYLSPLHCPAAGGEWSPGGEWMTHVWLIPNPEGVFSDWNPTVV
jgi:hypothetical protein